MKRKKRKTIKPKRKSMKTVKNKLDKVFNDYIKKRDGQCVICGKLPVPNSDGTKLIGLDASHFVPKARGFSIRWDVRNVHAQCRGCHHVWHHLTPIPYMTFMREKYGIKIFDELDQASAELVKYKVHQLESMIEYFQEEVDKLG
jgi:5-methylcytosine-specific restriction endonuclease McrA